ncbi:HD domain-containing phosphohydrolase [uncultured Fusobacterium sp.]|uniref:HD domain-containing phosphohydrolase n=1 Tax=uncultured Fusobacterium sp. TaxID=159267 RepID=UPI0025D79C9E|nr:HD domain-containing phosphohydrolase [uncultured Fusobacterium sp.]
MKRLVFYFFLITSIVFGGEGLKVGYPLNLTDMYFYKDLESIAYKGVYSDLLKDFNKDGKYDFEYQGGNETGDLVLRVTQNEENENYNYIVTPFSYRAVMLVNMDSMFTKVDDLYGLTVGYVKNQRGIEAIEGRNKGVEFYKTSFENENQAMLALKNKKVDAIVLKDWNESNPLEKNFRVISTVLTKEQIGVNKTKVDLYESLKKYFETLNDTTLSEIVDKNRIAFYTYLLKDTPDYSFIKEKYKSLKISLPKDKYYLPIYYEENGIYKGLLFNILDDIEKIVGIPFEVIADREKADIRGLYISKETDANFVATKPYYKTDIAVASTKKSYLMTEISDLDNSKVIVVENQTVGKYVEDRTEGVTLVTAPTIQEGVNKLIAGEGEYIVSYSNPLRGVILNTFVDKKVGIIGRINEKFGISMGVKADDEALFNIINTILNSYSVEETTLETNRTAQVIIKTDYSMAAKIGIPLAIIALILAIALRKAVINKRKAEKIGNTLLETMVKVNQLKQTESGLHAKRISLHAEVLGEKLGLSKDLIDGMKQYAIIHDIGKVIVPADILNKSGKLTPEEFEVMKKHPEFGYEIIKELELGKIAENVARYHHEKWNGKGYPLGLKGEEIPLEGRVIGILDVYDSMREDKVYKKGLSHQEAIEIIKNESGVSFDPKIVKVFLENEKLFEDIYNKTSGKIDLVEEYYRIMK